MTAHSETVPSLVDRIKQTLVGLKMPRAIEILDVTVRRIERGELTAIEAIDALLKTPPNRRQFTQPGSDDSVIRPQTEISHR
jgi:hypothetical protein